MFRNPTSLTRRVKQRGLGTLSVFLVLGLSVLIQGVPASAQQGVLAQVASTTGAETTSTKIQLRRREGWRPAPGAKFNVARVGGEPQFRLEQQVIASINRARPGSTIKMAMFSFDRMPVADALVRARKRKVRVQVILNGHEFPAAQRKLSRVLGPRTVTVVVRDKNGETSKKVRQRLNFFYLCKAACRGDGDVQHSKFILFSQTGVARKVVMLGSLNMKLNGSLNQFNDLLTVNASPKMYNALDTTFDEMRLDRVLANSYRRYRIDDRFQLEVMPYPRSKSTAKTKWTPYRDPIIRLLRPVKCTQARTNSGRTIVRVNMHAWDGSRGVLIANRLRDLYSAGCDVMIHVGFAGSSIRKIFAAPTKRGRVPIRSTGFDTTGDGEIDLYSHAKILLVNGNYDGNRGRKMVVTGSSNFQNGGQYGDELILRIFDPRIYRKYADNWGYLWRNHTHGFSWGANARTRGIVQAPEYTLTDGLGTNSPEWNDQ